MRKSMGVMMTLLLAFVLTASARADSVYVATLNGAQQVPPINVPGTGLGTITLNTAGNQITVNLGWQNLTGNATMGHIHGPALPGQTAGVLIPFWGMDAPKPSTGNFTGTFDVTSQFVTFLQSGQLYFNIHTPNNPNGEIRGQISAVPEPATMLLLGTGLAGIGARIRNRRRNNY